MKKFSAKNKIYLAVFVWLVLCASMFGYFFSILDGGNTVLISTIHEQKAELQQLQDEQKSFLKAQSDLKKVSSEPLQPTDFFSQDITLVHEIQSFEDLAKQTGVDITIGGVSGTIKTLNRAQTKSEVFTVPFGVTINGPLQNDVAFLDGMEHLAFLNTMSNFNVGIGPHNTVYITTAGFLYLKKQ